NEGPLEQAAAKAMAFPIGAPDNKRRNMPKYNGFLSLVFWLQDQRGDHPIYLSCREVARVLKSTPRMVNHWRNIAVEDGVIEKVRDHSFRSAGKSEATEFRVKEDYREWFEGFRRRSLT